jgi:peptidoglycan hydrolase-like amidase
MRRLIAIAVLLAGFAVPGIVDPPVASAAVCTGWNSVMTPPPTIKVLRSSGVVETVDFKTYVKVVMPAEWTAWWPYETQRAGAITIKQYAWYRAMHWRGGSKDGNCYDVVDNTNDQIYSPETRSPSAGQIAAVEGTWPLSITKSGSLFLTSYRSGSSSVKTCGADATGGILYQYSSFYCATGGKTAEQILLTYYYPATAIAG